MQDNCRFVWSIANDRYNVVEDRRDLDSVIVRQAFIEVCSELKDFDNVEAARIIGKSYETVTRAVRLYQRGETYNTPLYHRARKFFRKRILNEEDSKHTQLLIDTLLMIKSLRSDLNGANKHLSLIGKSVSTEELDKLESKIKFEL
jgi:hypothetical protein